MGVLIMPGESNKALLRASFGAITKGEVAGLLERIETEKANGYVMVKIDKGRINAVETAPPDIYRN